MKPCSVPQIGLEKNDRPVPGAASAAVKTPRQSPLSPGPVGTPRHFRRSSRRLGNGSKASHPALTQRHCMAEAVGRHEVLSAGPLQTLHLGVQRLYALPLLCTLCAYSVQCVHFVRTVTKHPLLMHGRAYPSVRGHRACACVDTAHP